ncbi:MAG: hypothetical protein LBB25_01350 [Holosporaceae bacterium]|jgi:hypothetical protein|nr:hypothetical protein [Holosporaceae bacterium]
MINENEYVISQLSPNNVLPPELLETGSGRYDWYITADKIFRSKVTGLENFAKIYGIKFQISKFSLLNGKKSSDSAMALQKVEVFLESGSHCAMIQGRMAKNAMIPKIIIKKISSSMGKIEILEEKEFSSCVIDEFSITGEIVSFSFHYLVCLDSYTDFHIDGTKYGNVANQVNIADKD